MGCAECELAQQRLAGGYPYRWGVADLLVFGCQGHVAQMLEYLNAKLYEDRMRRGQR
jgi:hypothetical protein